MRDIILSDTQPAVQMVKQSLFVHTRLVLASRVDLRRGSQHLVDLILVVGHDALLLGELLEVLLRFVEHLQHLCVPAQQGMSRRSLRRVVGER